MQSNNFSTHIIVSINDIDKNNHVNNLVYLQWAHKISAEHWNTMVPNSIQSKYTWVVGRQEIDYLAEIKLNDTIRLETFIEKMEKQKCYRNILFYNSSNNILMAKAQIVWIMLDANSKKPMRIGDDIKELFK